MRCMRIACWMPKATNTHPPYVILIAFPLQQWLHDRALMLRYTYFHVLCILFLKTKDRRVYEHIMYLFTQVYKVPSRTVLDTH